jgi:hypothetical protein
MSAPFDLDRAIEALRVSNEDDAGLDADATRFRIRESLDHARVVRSRMLAVLVVFGMLGTGGVSWAYLSGRLDNVWPWLVNLTTGSRASAPEPKPAPQLAQAARPAEPSSKVRVSAGEPTHGIAQAPPLAPISTPLPELAPPALAALDEPPTAPALPARRAPARTVDHAPARPIEQTPAIVATPPAAAPPAPAASEAAPALAADAPDLYRAAHQLHFHARDTAAALTAWDAYLASQPSGRFAIEARYNRAMALIRLRRYRDAVTALEPFARGEIMPVGYRQSEAVRLTERLTRALAGEAK